MGGETAFGDANKPGSVAGVRKMVNCMRQIVAENEASLDSSAAQVPAQGKRIARAFTEGGSPSQQSSLAVDSSVTSISNTTVNAAAAVTALGPEAQTAAGAKTGASDSTISTTNQFGDSAASAVSPKSNVIGNRSTTRRQDSPVTGTSAARPVKASFNPKEPEAKRSPREGRKVVIVSPR